MSAWDLTTLPLTKIFWSLMAIEVAGFGAMMIMAASTGGHTPEGPVGGWLIFIPPVAWAILALLFCAGDVIRARTRAYNCRRSPTRAARAT